MPQTSFKVTMLHKDTFQGKEIVVQANSKDDAEKKARTMQQFPRKWNVILVKVDACTMNSKFKQKGVRYTR